MKREHEEIVSIEGALMMLDNVTPHVAVPVQMIQDGEVIATTLSDETGKYAFVNLEQRWYQVRCQVPEGYACYGEERGGERESQSVPRGAGCNS